MKAFQASGRMTDMKAHGLNLAIGFLISLACSPALADASGKFILEGEGFISKPPPQVAQTEAHFNGEYDRKDALTNHLNFRFHPVWRTTSAHGANQTDAVLDPRELFLEAAGENSSLQIGYFTPLWEGTDGLNPMDIATMRDEADPLNQATMGSPGVRLAANGSSVEGEVFWVPQQTRSRIFGPNSPWWPRRVAFPLRSDAYELLLPSQVDYEINERQELNHALSNNVGGRVQFHGGWGDAALAYFEGAAQTPVLYPDLDADLSPTTVNAFILRSPVRITPIDYRRRSFSGLLSVPTGSWIWRLSARSDSPIGDDERIPKWSQVAVGGFEKATEIGSNTVTFLLQGSYGRRSEDAGLLSVSDLFDRAVMVGLRYPVGEKWTIMLSGFRSLRDQSNFWSAEVTRKITDSLSAEAFMQEFDGRPETLLGILSDRDRGGLRLVHAF